MPFSEVACPVAHEIATPDVLPGENASQLILDNPDYIPDILGNLKLKWEDQYGPVREYNPGLAAVHVARKVRSGFRGVHGALLYPIMVEILNRRKTPESRDSYITSLADADYPYEIKENVAYLGQADRWMKSVMQLHEEASEHLWCGQGHAAYIHRRLNEYSPNIYKQLAEAYESAEDPQKADLWREMTYERELHLADRENIEGAFDVILAGSIAMYRGSKGAHAPDAMATNLFNNLPALTRLSSIKRNLFQLMVPSLKEGEVFAPDGSDLERLEHTFSYKDGLLVPRHPSLKDGPWKKPGNCAGIFRLRLPQLLRHTTDAVGEFYAGLGYPQYGPDTNNAIQPLDSLYGVGIEASRRTTLIEHNSPIIGRYALAA